MQFDLIAIGKRMPVWVDSAFTEYSKRLPKKTPATRSKNINPEQ